MHGLDWEPGRKSADGSELRTKEFVRRFRPAPRAQWHSRCTAGIPCSQASSRLHSESGRQRVLRTSALSRANYGPVRARDNTRCAAGLSMSRRRGTNMEVSNRRKAPRGITLPQVQGGTLMWRRTQISHVPAILARRASATLMSTVFAIAFAVAAADPLPNGYDAPLSTPLVVPTAPVPTAVPVTPTRPTSAPQIQVPSSPSVPTTISPGRSTSSFSVSNSGVATYMIPLWTPPGVGSDQLKLALSYGHQSPDGVMGVGWNLSGMSNVTRCNRTWAQDGVVQGITLTTSDRLCLDGEQLKVVSGSPSAPAQGGTTFATEIESFSRIVAAGSSGSAPTSLTVTTKNGLIYDYGLTVDSQIMGGPNGPIRAWALSQIRDRVGNTIKFSYYNDAQSGTGYTNGSYRIKEIDYPYTASGQGPFYSVTFSYGARPAGTNVPSGYIAGGIVQEPNQLNSISIQNYGSSTPTKAYYLTYATNSVSSRLELQQVQECSATNCYPATKVGYQTGSQGWSGRVLVFRCASSCARQGV